VLRPFKGMGGRPSAIRPTDVSRYTRIMHSETGVYIGDGSIYHHKVIDLRPQRKSLGFPFASISVLVVLGTLFAMSMLWGGWGWSSWTYAFSFAIMVPLFFLEKYRGAVITGGALILLTFMVLIDAGMPGYLGYNPSDLNWYDNVAHYLGAAGLTLFLWAFIWWTVSPTGPPAQNGHRKFMLTIVIMLIISVFFEFTEFFSDFLFGWRNFHPGVDTIGDLIFDIAGITTAAVVIGRHKYSPLKRPFWHSEGYPA
jgi:hypothetical protein